MGAWDGWAALLAAGGVGGATTGTALWFTIRHDRTARRDDRIEASIDKALAVCSDFIGMAATASDTEMWSEVTTFAHAARILEARLGLRKRTVQHNVIENLSALSKAVIERYPNAPRTKLTAQERTGVRAAVAAYSDAIGDLLNARSYLAADLGSPDLRLAKFDRHNPVIAAGTAHGATKRDDTDT
jgi:hypothetical protein